jgi:phage-related minor tail protein
MPEQEVQIQYLAKDQAVLSSLANTEKALKLIADRMGQVEHSSKSAAHAAETGFDKVTDTLRDVAKETLGIVGAFSPSKKSSSCWPKR